MFSGIWNVIYDFINYVENKGVLAKLIKNAGKNYDGIRRII